jgi:hypothetical protein
MASSSANREKQTEGPLLVKMSSYSTKEAFLYINVNLIFFLPAGNMRKDILIKQATLRQ